MEEVVKIRCYFMRDMPGNVMVDNGDISEGGPNHFMQRVEFGDMFSSLIITKDGDDDETTIRNLQAWRKVFQTAVDMLADAEFGIPEKGD